MKVGLAPPNFAVRLFNRNREGYLRDPAYIVGVGESKFCRAPGSGMSDLQLMIVASLRTLADAGLRPGDIDAIMPPVMSVSIVVVDHPRLQPLGFITRTGRSGGHPGGIQTTEG